MAHKILYSQFENIATVRGFTLNPLNREIKDQNVNDLRKTLFKDGEWQGLQPIMVNVNTNNILDGQNRRELFFRLIDEGKIDPAKTELYIEYVQMSYEEETQYIIDLQKSKNWQTEDFCRLQIIAGNKDIATLKKFCDESIICAATTKNGKLISRAYRLANIILTGDRNENHIRQGKVHITKDDLVNGKIMQDEMVKLLNALQLNPLMGRSGLEGLAGSWRKIRKYKYSVDDYVKEFTRGGTEPQDNPYIYGPKTNKTWGVATWDKFFRGAMGGIEFNNAITTQTPKKSKKASA